MKKLIQSIVFTCLIMLTFGGAARAQGPNQAEKIPVKVLLVISRFEGERKVSSLPYTTYAIANGDRASISVGSNVPIMNAAQSSDGKAINTVSYTNIGTNVNFTVTTESGRYKISLDIRDQAMFEPKLTTAPGAIPKPSDYQSWSNFQYNGTVTLTEGETKQVISAADKINGAVVKLDVTLTLDK